jgi:hypothetical protein
VGGRRVAVGGKGVAVAVGELFLSGLSPWVIEGPQPEAAPARNNTTTINQIVLPLVLSPIAELPAFFM